MEAHVVQPLLLAPLFGNGQWGCREVNPHNLTGHGRKPHGHVSWASGDFQDPVLGGRTHGVHEPGNTLRVSNGRIRGISHRLTRKLFAHYLIVLFGLWHGRFILC